MAEGANNSKYNVGRHSVGRVQVFDKIGQGGLVKVVAARDDGDNALQVVAAEAMLVCMTAHGIDDGVDLFSALLGGKSGCWRRASAGLFSRSTRGELTSAQGVDGGVHGSVTI